jgi:hypothetical protein
LTAGRRSAPVSLDVRRRRFTGRRDHWGIEPEIERSKPYRVSL